MGIEDLGGLGGLGGMGGSAGFNMENLEKQMVEMCKTTLEDMRKNQQVQQTQLQARQQQLLNRKKGTANLTPEQIQQWKELEAMIMANPEFIVPLGLTVAGLVRSKQDTRNIIEEFPDLRFEMVNFLREKAEKRRNQQTDATRSSAAPTVAKPPEEMVTLD